MNRWIAILIAALILLVPATASAAPASTAAGDIPIAEEFWGGPPTQCESLTIGYTPPPGDGGFATIPSPGWYGPCVMELSEVGTVFGGGVVITPETACVIVIHEEGHLHGYNHSEDPTSVMQANPWATPIEVMAPVCVEPAPIALPPTKAKHKVSRKHHRRFAHNDSI